MLFTRGTFVINFQLAPPCMVSFIVFTAMVQSWPSGPTLVLVVISDFFLLNIYQMLMFSYFRATMLHNAISSHHRRDTTMATLLSSIVVVFLCCHSTKLVTNTYEAYQMVYYGELMVWPPWAEVLSRWNHFMLATNASINIFIYVVKVGETQTCK